MRPSDESCRGGGSCGALAVEVHQVGEDWFGAELAEKRCYLAARVSAVISEVLHGLPERIFVYAEIERFVFEDAIEIGLGKAVGKSEQFVGVRPPELAQCSDGLRTGSIRKCRRSAAL